MRNRREGEAASDLWGGGGCHAVVPLCRWGHWSPTAWASPVGNRGAHCISTYAFLFRPGSCGVLKDGFFFLLKGSWLGFTDTLVWHYRNLYVLWLCGFTGLSFLFCICYALHSSLNFHFPHPIFGASVWAMKWWMCSYKLEKTQGLCISRSYPFLTQALGKGWLLSHDVSSQGDCWPNPSGTVHWCCFTWKECKCLNASRFCASQGCVLPTSCSAFLEENTTFQTVVLLLFKNLICVRQPGFPITF